MEKTWFMAPMEKALRHQRNMSSWFIAPMKKAWFYERLFKKIQDKRYNVNQNYLSFMSIKCQSFWCQSKFYALYEVDKSNNTCRFRGIWSGLYFFATFFLLSLLIYIRSTKIWGGGLPVPPPGFYGPVKALFVLKIFNC